MLPIHDIPVFLPLRPSATNNNGRKEDNLRRGNYRRNDVPHRVCEATTSACTTIDRRSAKVLQDMISSAGNGENGDDMTSRDVTVHHDPTNTASIFLKISQQTTSGISIGKICNSIAKTEYPVSHDRSGDTPHRISGTG